jgi:GntR family transcriptional regulator/MocR family aminotransferase
MDLFLRMDGRGDLSGQIYRQVRESVLAGRLPAGEPMPPSRELARQLGVARNTVSMAYDRLTAEGFLTARQGVGTFVAELATGTAAMPQQQHEVGDAALRPRPVWASVAPPMILTAGDAEYDLRPGIPDAGLFPYAAWRRVTARQLRVSAVGNGAHIDPAGDPELRAAIARHVASARGVPAEPADVIVTSGSQQALDVLVVAVEDPGYPLPRKLLTSAGLKVVSVPVDAEGLVVDALPDAARLVHVTPSHQFPLGMPMSLRRRLALLDWARRTGALVVEDDYDSEFRFAGRPFEPLVTLGGAEHVAYVGSFSKSLLPTLRLGYVLPPPSLWEAMHKAKQVIDWHTAAPAQAALAEFIADGLLARHVRRMRRIYTRRHHLIVEGLGKDFAGVLRPVPSLVGLHVTAVLDRADVTDTEIVARARQAGVATFPLSMFAVDADVQGLVLGYGPITEEAIPEALARLRACFG